MNLRSQKRKTRGTQNTEIKRSKNTTITSAGQSTSAVQSAPVPEENVNINIVLFSCPDPDSSPCETVAVPVSYLQKSLSLCVPVFAVNLQRLYGIATASDSKFKFFSPTERVLGASVDNLSPDDLIALQNEKFKTVNKFELLKTILIEANKHKTTEEDPIVMLGINVKEATSTNDVSDPELSPLKCYERLLRNPGERPSTGSKSAAYAENQANPSTTIHDGRRARGKQDTVAPHVHMYHPIFLDFQKYVAEAPAEMTDDHIRKTQAFMAAASVIYPAEDKRMLDTWKCLNAILGTSIHAEKNSDGTCPDGTEVVVVDEMGVIIEIKREYGEGGSDPSTQAGLSMKRLWIQDDKKQIRELCCCPTFCLAIGGPWLCVMGAVLTKDVIVQRLTNMQWVVWSGVDDGARLLEIASILWAFQKALQKLKEFYRGLAKSSRTKLTDSHPRFYPFPTSFQMEGQTITFTYLHPLEPHASCVTFQVEIITDCNGLPFQKGDKVVVKFASKYGTEVHRFLADHRFAPALYYVGEVPEWKLAVKAPPPDLKVQGMTFGVSLMIVMAFVKTGKQTVGELRAQQVAKILHLLHCSGFVFGDLRPPNILFNGQCLYFVDFDWTGCFNSLEAIKNLKGVPLSVQKEIKSLRPRTDIARFPPNVLSKLFEEDSLGLKPILPHHDWRMWRKHFPLPRHQEDMILQDLH